MTNDLSEWLLASEAVTQLTNSHGNSKAVKLWLADALRDGLLEAKVAATWVSEASKLSFQVPDDGRSIEHNAIIPPSRWQASKTWAADQEQWRWPYNHFFVTIRRTPRRRRIFKGVSFARTGVDELAKISTTVAAAPNIPAVQGRRGRTTPASKWGLVAAKLVEMQQAGELTSNLDLTANGLATMLKSRTNEIFGETSMQAFCTSFLREYHKR